uniref:Nucleolar protein 10 n=1 Tax=Rhizophora mucronata TaxID=61149 RepID=A0A2P2KSS8_RHIMU
MRYSPSGVALIFVVAVSNHKS